LKKLKSTKKIIVLGDILEKHYLPGFEKTPTNKANNLITKK